MKKIISMLLVLTMVVTTLMGVMVIDVSAVSSTDFTTSVKITPATETASRKIEYTFGVPTVPAASPNPTVNSAFRYATGEWYATGYTYDGKLSTTVTSLDATGKYDAVNFADVSVVNNPLDPTNSGEMSKISFKPVTIKDDTRTANNAAVSANYLRFMLMGKDLDANFDMKTVTNFWDANTGFSVNESFADLKTADLKDKALTKGGAYVYTFYAYTNKNAKANSVTFLARDNDTGAGEISLPEQYIYSESALTDGTKGVPHKVQFVVSGSALSDVYYHIYVDGVEMGSGLKAARTLSKANFKLVLSQNIALTGTSFAIKEADWYVSKAPTGLIAPVLMTADELKNELIVVPSMTATTQASTYRTDDYITGVNADVDSGIKAALESTAIGDNRVEIYESVYNDVTKVVDKTVVNPTVKLVNRTTGEEVEYAKATGSMDNYYFMVNGVYVIPVKVADPLPYVKAYGVAFKTSVHNGIETRTKHENYVDNDYADEKSFGGLTEGFYRFTNEPRSSVGFSDGAVKYNENGYVNMVGYNGWNNTSATSAARTNYDVEKNIATVEWDMYIPEYTPAGSNNYHILLAAFNNGWANSNRHQEEIYFITDGIKGTISSNNIVDLPANEWSTVTLSFDMTDTVNDGYIDCKVYVNGTYQRTIEYGAGNFKDEAESYFFPMAFMRMFSPAYTAYGVTPGAWYMGEYTPKATPVSESEITSSDSNITVYEDNLLIASKYSSDDKLIASLSRYVPVYTSIIDSAVVNAKYDEVDGRITSKAVENNNLAHTGIIIKRLCDLAGWFDITTQEIPAEEGGEPTIINIYTKKDTADANIVSAVDNGDGTATLTVTRSFAFSSTVEGAYHNVDSLLAEYPELKTEDLIGFAVVDEGCLPKVYSIVQSGLTLRSLTFNTATNNAELNYRKFGEVDGEGTTFRLIVAAYDDNNRMLELKAGESTKINTSTVDGENTIIFAPGFSEATLSSTEYYKVFMFNSLAEAIPLMTATKVMK